MKITSRFTIVHKRLLCAAKEEPTSLADLMKALAITTGVSKARSAADLLVARGLLVRASGYSHRYCITPTGKVIADQVRPDVEKADAASKSRTLRRTAGAA